MARTKNVLNKQIVRFAYSNFGPVCTQLLPDTKAVLLMIRDEVNLQHIMERMQPQQKLKVNSMIQLHAKKKIAEKRTR